MSGLLGTVVVPVADEDVAAATARAADDHLDGDSRVVLVHVVDEDDEFTPESEWREFAERAFDRVREELGERPIETEVRHGEDVARTVFDVAEDHDATAIVFRSRGGSRWRQILAGDVAREIVTEAPLPVVVLPRGED